MLSIEYVSITKIDFLYWWAVLENGILYQQTTMLLTSDFWQFLEPWHQKWYEYKVFVASSTDNIYDLEKERWMFGEVVDRVGIYGSRETEGLSTFNVSLVLIIA